MPRLSLISILILSLLVVSRPFPLVNPSSVQLLGFYYAFVKLPYFRQFFIVVYIYYFPTLLSLSIFCKYFFVAPNPLTSCIPVVYHIACTFFLFVSPQWLLRGKAGVRPPFLEHPSFWGVLSVCKRLHIDKYDDFVDNIWCFVEKYAIFVSRARATQGCDTGRETPWAGLQSNGCSLFKRL